MNQSLPDSGPCPHCGQPKEAHDQGRCPSAPLAYSGPCYRCGQPEAAHPQGRCPSPPLRSQSPHRGSGTPNPWVLIGVGLAVVLAAFVIEHGTRFPASNSATPCNVFNSKDQVEVKIIAPRIHGCTNDVRDAVGYWGYLGLGFSWEFNAPGPTGSAVCTDTSGGEKRVF